MATHVCIDVDLTVINENDELLPGVVEGLKALKDRGYFLVLWSSCGEDYARSVARRKHLYCFFDSYATKPDIAVDDQCDKTRSFPVVDARAWKTWQEISAEVQSLAEERDAPANLNLPDWIRSLWENKRDSGVAATKAIWLNQKCYFRWPKVARVLHDEWIRIPDPNRDDLYDYPENIKAECFARGMRRADARSNGPAIVAFLLSGGARPFREEPSSWGWSIHHIYDGQFPAPHQRSDVLNAVGARGHFTNSAGLVAAHPVAHFVAANSPLLAWLLRWKASQLFNYDPDRVFPRS